MDTVSSPVALELLAPARTADIGIEAILHGADAVYIGGPSFGARAQAGNRLEDIARLVTHAHRYRAQVFVALNTLLRDDELETARQLAWAVYEAGADALILQDMGLLEMDLPPIALHASTQTDIRSPEKAAFLDKVGFSQMVLARELDLEQIRQIAARTQATLEFFVHGALCVSYSGQCYISHAHTGRSANRGECSQACRLPYDLAHTDGTAIAKRRHLLSMKDNDQSDNLKALALAGIRSFKIEGRLKDMSYVKNITAHYRRLLDALIESEPARFKPASQGRCEYRFEPRPEKTFNRGSTDYFVHGRKEGIAAFETPAFAGESLGTVTACGPTFFELDGAVTLNNGDGVSYFQSDDTLAGLSINRAESLGVTRWRCHVRERLPSSIKVGTTLFRNRDHAFEQLLAKPSATRRVPIWLHLDEAEDGFRLTAHDEEGSHAQATLTHPREEAHDGPKALEGLRTQLARLGNTLYEARAITLNLSRPWFLPLGQINALRRDVLARLDVLREAAYVRPARRMPDPEPPLYPESALSYLGNVYNRKADAFYRRHGVRLIEAAYEANQEAGEVSLMIARHCLRYNFNLCPKEVRGIKPTPLLLTHGKEQLTLVFDCKKCEMHVMGRLKAHRVFPLKAV
jgi:23S rRNA 5-hydroxycytidine C2501 synthase